MYNGKWQVYNDGEDMWIISAGNPREADCFAKMTIDSKKRAVLMAAAPELLDALEGMVEVWDGPRDRAAVRFAQQVVIARAAIAKAKGL